MPIAMGCKYCGELPQNMGVHARQHRCCQKCFIERFANPEEKAEYIRQKELDKDDKLVMPKTVVQRVDADKVKIKKWIWEE